MLIATYVSAALICIASLVVGRAALRLLGRADPEPLEPAVGLAVLITVGLLGVRMPGRATTTLIAICLLVGAALLYLWTRDERFRTPAAGGTVVAALTLLAASLPFIASGDIAVLGIGVNNDLAMHLDLAAWIDDPIGLSPTEFKTGYPLGPHGLVAAIATGIGSEPLAPFLGLTLALPVLTAITAYMLLDDLGPIGRGAASVLTGLPYLAASTLGVAGFKETTMALLVLGLALALREVSQGEGSRRVVVAVVALVAGMFAVYSYPGIGYAVAVIGTWALVEFIRAARRGEAERVTASLRGAAPYAIVSAGVLVLIGIAEQSRIRKFTDSVDVVVEASSRLKETVSPLEALAVWPSGDYLDGTSALEVYWLFGAIGLIALAIGVAGAVRRDERALLAALAGGVVVYLFMLAIGGLYVQAKALVIIAPLVALLVLWALLGPRGRGDEGASEAVPERGASPLRVAAAVVFVSLAAYSSFLALRDARVAPGAHGAEELGKFRSAVRGKTVLSLTSDRFTDYYLRGSDVFGPGKYSEEQIVPRAGKLERFPVDFDSVVPGALDRFDYAVTTKAAYRSAPPPNFTVAQETDSFILWERAGRTPLIGVLPEEERPGSVLDCKRDKLREIVARAKREGYTTAVVQPKSVVGKRLYWKPQSKLADGEEISQALQLPRGSWELSLQYYSPALDITVETLSRGGAGSVGVSAPDITSQATLRATADGGFKFRTDQGPFWPVGTVTSIGLPVEVTVRATGLSDIQKLLGVDQVAEIGNLTAARPEEARQVPLDAACGLYVDHYFANRPAPGAKPSP